MNDSPTITLEEAVQVLAVVGDLSMGQPIDQSIRTARLAERLALEDGAGPAAAGHARLVALLRWSGCTANAAGFAHLLGDDVHGRQAMLAHLLPPDHPLGPATVTPLAHIHCEVAGELAAMLGLPAQVEAGLRHTFEHHDGSGLPLGLRDAEIPAPVYYAGLASDFDILARVHGEAEALRIVEQLAGRKYPARLVRLLAPHAQAWRAALEEAGQSSALPPQAPNPATRVPLSIVADLTELKLPWLAGYSRRAAELAVRAAGLAGLGAQQQERLGRAALLHGIGRAAVPNSLWERVGKLDQSEWEKVRLAPYWTSRVAAQVPSLRPDALLASHAYERLDGSGYFRGLEGDALDVPQRLLAAALAYAALCMARPWRPAYPPAEAARLLNAQAQGGAFCSQAAAWVLAAVGVDAPPRKRGGLLSEREAEVLQRISLGDSNKEAARALQISPATVRTHIESIFRKLECSTRAAATLKALTLGLI